MDIVRLTRNFLKDTATFVKHLPLKVWHDGNVYHSLKRSSCCLRVLQPAKSNNGKRTFWNKTYSSLSCLTCLCLLKELDF